MLCSLSRPPLFSSYIISLKLVPLSIACLTPACVSSPPHLSMNRASVTLSISLPLWLTNVSKDKGLSYTYKLGVEMLRVLTFLFSPSKRSLSRTFLNWISLASFSLSSSINSSAKLCCFNIDSSNLFVTSRSFYILGLESHYCPYLKFSRCLQFNFLLQITFPLKKLKEAWILSPHLHLLLWCSIAMPKDSYNWPQFPSIFISYF